MLAVGKLSRPRREEGEVVDEGLEDAEERTGPAGKGGNVAPPQIDLAISSKLFLNSSSLKEDRSATLPK